MARTSGSGPPALLLHGGPGLSDYLAPLAAELDSVLCCVRYQQRGIEPAPTDGPLDVTAHVSDALAVLDAIGGEPWLVGHSWGGHLALQVAVEAPHRVRGLVLIGSLGAEGDGGWDALDATIESRLTPAAAAEVEQAEAELERGADDADAVALRALRAVWPAYFADPAAAPPAPDDLRTGQAAYEEGRVSVLAGLEAGTLRRELPELDLPVLLVHGTDDPLPLSSAEGLARLLPRSRLVVLEGCGHFPWLEQPGVVADAVAAFLDQAA
jgi:proline iminopeptidase